MIRLFLLLGTFMPLSIYAQTDSSDHAPNRHLAPICITGGVLYGGSLLALNEVWYDEKVPFHFFNDNAQWLQMDKAGHVTTAYYIAELCDRSLQFGGLSDRSSLMIGSAISFSYLSAIEILDGYSEKWGFSNGDFIANLGGIALYSGQQLAFNEQRFRLKYNFIPSEFAAYRPDALGVGFWQQALKDYNGQAYWLTSNPRHWGAGEGWPKWLGFALGYSASGMTGGRENSFPLLDANDDVPHFDRVRQYYLSVDIDLDGIEAKRNWFKAFRRIFAFVKVPLPAIGIDSRGTFLYGIR